MCDRQVEVEVEERDEEEKGEKQKEEGGGKIELSGFSDADLPLPADYNGVIIPHHHIQKHTREEHRDDRTPLEVEVEHLEDMHLRYSKEKTMVREAFEEFLEQRQGRKHVSCVLL